MLMRGHGEMLGVELLNAHHIIGQTAHRKSPKQFNKIIPKGDAGPRCNPMLGVPVGHNALE